jgi:flavin reductase (DIM6/NTAB) family NADH-FMN oxidoreductase RutF
MTLEAPADVRLDALHMLSNGVYVLTACVGETVHAVTVTWVSQVSIQPPLVLTALRRNSRVAGAVRQARRFALNVLEAGQETLAERFFEHTTVPEDSPALSGLAFRSSPARCALLIDALGWVECRVAAEPATPGDHWLILGEVTGAGVRRQGRPLVLHDTPWSYGGLRATSEASA